MKNIIDSNSSTRSRSQHRIQSRSAAQKVQKERRPVMCCLTASGSTSRLERGSSPSTPASGGFKKHRRLIEVMFFRCTHADKLLIEHNAAKAGVEKSSYLRAQSTGKSLMRASRRVRVDWDELRRCMGVINKAGNVVNQLVMELRIRGRSSGLAHLALNELTAAARCILGLLGRR